MLSLTIPTMTCGACEKRVRKALTPISGIEGVTIDLPTHRVYIAGTAEAAGVIEALRQAGYPPLGA